MYKVKIIYYPQEEEVNKWLANNPKIKITFVKYQLTNNSNDALLIMYEDQPKELPELPPKSMAKGYV